MEDKTWESDTDLEYDARSLVARGMADSKRCDYIIGDRRSMSEIEL